MSRPETRSQSNTNRTDPEPNASTVHPNKNILVQIKEAELAAAKRLLELERSVVEKQLQLQLARLSARGRRASVLSRSRVQNPSTTELHKQNEPNDNLPLIPDEHTRTHEPEQNAAPRTRTRTTERSNIQLPVHYPWSVSVPEYPEIEQAIDDHEPHSLTSQKGTNDARDIGACPVSHSRLPIEPRTLAASPDPPTALEQEPMTETAAHTNFSNFVGCANEELFETKEEELRDEIWDNDNNENNGEVMKISEEIARRVDNMEKERTKDRVNLKCIKNVGKSFYYGFSGTYELKWTRKKWYLPHYGVRPEDPGAVAMNYDSYRRF